MPKTVTAREAKNKLGSIVSWVLQTQDEVIVENRGAPTVVIMTYTEYERVRELKEQDRRRQAIDRMRGLRDQVMAQNKDLTPQQGDDLADEIARDAINSLIENGKLRFEE
jgi:prevent-host-death family protein